MSQTSNNKRCQLKIRCMYCNSGRIDLVYDDVRYIVYPCLDYSFCVLISWSRKSGFYCWYCRVCFHQVLFQISGFMIIIIIIILYMYSSWLTTCVLFHQSLVLIILYHACSLFDITYYLSTCSSMPVLTTRFSMHVYDLDLSIHVCLSLHAIWHSRHYSQGSSDSPGSSYSGFKCWSLWILSVDDQSSAAVA